MTKLELQKLTDPNYYVIKSVDETIKRWFKEDQVNIHARLYTLDGEEIHTFVARNYQNHKEEAHEEINANLNEHIEKSIAHAKFLLEHTDLE